jgi:hypothetical protein
MAYSKTPGSTDSDSSQGGVFSPFGDSDNPAELPLIFLTSNSGSDLGHRFDRAETSPSFSVNSSHAGPKLSLGTRYRPYYRLTSIAPSRGPINSTTAL